jgi:beta-N-acetylhexosaminidase
MLLIDRAVRFGLIVMLTIASVWPDVTMAQTPDASAAEVASATGPEADVAALDLLVEETLATMSVADRVGQLFLITFAGDDVGFESDIAELIYGYRVGGIVLDPANRNFSNEINADTPTQVATLTNRLQGLAYGLLLPSEDALPSEAEEWTAAAEGRLEEMTDVAPLNLPLLIGVQQLGDGLPETALRRGFTPLPSQMALGATWNPDLAHDVGEIVGSELRAVGVNFMLGPNLDVLDRPLADPVGRLGTHMYGGDPQWVGRMGEAYIAGVHAGSAHRVATIAGRFPGAGDMDRLPDEEVSTVQRPLQELLQITLPPFQRVTGGGTQVATERRTSMTDGLMSSQARYSAFQGSSLGRNTPIGLAPELETVLQEQGFGEWRNRGGVMVSGELGAPAIQKHYAVGPGDFPFRRIALDAFTAGHDLLYLGRFSSDGAWESQRFNIKETIGFFQERYVDDPDFALDVDERVRRILRLKLRLYGADANSTVRSLAAGSAEPRGDGSGAPPVPFEEVLVDDDGVQAMQEARPGHLSVVAQVARESISILYPDPREVAEALSRIPQAGENILIITDSRLDRECADCTVDPGMGPDEIGEIILRLYGPEATDQLVGDEITSKTFADLQGLLAAEAQVDPESANGPRAIPTVTPAPAPSPAAVVPETEGTEAAPAVPAAAPDAVEEQGLDANEKIAQAIDDADWIIFAMLDVDQASDPNSAAVKRFLRQHSDDLATKYVVVFAMNAPYFLDATEISKLNAYYGVYGKTRPFLEDTVRALFRAYTPDGAPPVSVGGTRFNSLSERLAPDAGRNIALRIAEHDGTLLVDQESNGGEAPPTVDTETPILLQAGPVYDRNGNLVRDGQTVDFVLTFDGDDAAPRIEQVATRAGIAARELQPDRGGLVEVSARSGEATSGEPLALVVQPSVPAETEGVLADAPAAAEAPVEEPASDASVLPAVEPLDAEPAVEIPASDPIGLASLVITLLTIMVMVSMLVIVQVRVLPKRDLVHSILWAINCGLLAYILYVIGWIPGSGWLQVSLRIWGAALVVVLAMLAPLLWLQLRPEQ